MTFEELKALLFARSNFGMKLGLGRMEAALGLLGAPHRCAPVLHVAGSNGKGSTCAFTERALRAAGLKTGLYTSPHLTHYCERIRIDGVPIAEGEAASLLEELLARVPWALRGEVGPSSEPPAGGADAEIHVRSGGELAEGLTFFELTTLLAFLAFARAGVQVMVIEVGLGGRLDATNVVAPLACALAPIALEHTQYLGTTLAGIAAEKGGIIKPGVPVVSAGQPLVVARVFEELAARAQAPLWRPGRDYRFESGRKPFCYQRVRGPSGDARAELRGPSGDAHAEVRGEGWTVRAPPLDDDAPDARDPLSGLALRGHHQRHNAALACALLEVAAARGLPIAPEHAQQGLAHAQWPGRLQLLSRAPLTLLDGAHNPHGAQALARALPEQLGWTLREGGPGRPRPLHLVFGALADKEVAQLLEPLLPLCASVHLCAPRSPRALAVEPLAALVAALAPKVPCAAHASSALALAAARRAAGEDGEGAAVLACGSLYLVGELLALQGGALEAMPSELLARR